MEGVSHYGRACALCRPAPRRREDAPLCAEFGISRKTGYKLYDRYKNCGAEGLTDRTAISSGQSAAVRGRRADRAAQTGVPRLGRPEDPRKGAATIDRSVLSGDQHDPRGVGPARVSQASPAPPSRHARHRLVESPTTPNALWCADYKGEFMLGNRRYCYPLTITDFATRYLVACEALMTTQAGFAFPDLGYFDDETCRLEPIDNPFGPKVLPMSPE